jgi:hypothetical protein
VPAYYVNAPFLHKNEYKEIIRNKKRVYTFFLFFLAAKAVLPCIATCPLFSSGNGQIKMKACFSWGRIK